MYGKGRRKGTIRFAIRPPRGAQKVELAADCTGWQLVPMRRQKGGAYVRSVSAGPADEPVEYKFLVDGQWVTDPDNEAVTPNPFGTANSVATLD